MDYKEKYETLLKEAIFLEKEYTALAKMNNDLYKEYMLKVHELNRLKKKVKAIIDE